MEIYFRVLDPQVMFGEHGDNKIDYPVKQAPPTIVLTNCMQGVSGGIAHIEVPEILIAQTGLTFSHKREMDNLMPTVRGFIKSDSSGLVGSFDIDGTLYHLCIVIKPLSQGFSCTNATLTYSNIEKLIEQGTWSGSVGKTEVQIRLGDSVTIAGPLDAQRKSTSRVSGLGTWGVGSAPSPLLNSAGRKENSGGGAQATTSIQQTPGFPDPHKLARQRQLLESKAPIIAIFGQSGTGKSTFINLITSEKQKVGRGLQSCTSEISVLEAKVAGRPVVVIDTPGIDDTRPGMSETDILIAIARLLEYMGRERIWVTGVLFLHRITDNKFSQTASRVSNMVKNLCGDAAMSNLMLCTTMWDKVSREEGDERFEELCETGAWKEMVDMGASTCLISSVSSTAKADAESIISELIKDVPPVELAIVDQMVNQGKTVGETEAGKVLDSHIREAQKKAEREIKAMQEKLREESAASEAKWKDAIRAQEEEVEKLKKQTEAQSRTQQANAEQLRQERARAELEMENLRKQMRDESAANAAKVAEAMSSREIELERLRVQSEALARQTAASNEKRERERSLERKIDEMRDQARREDAQRAAEARETIMEQNRAILELQKQNQQLMARQDDGGCYIC